MSSWQTGIAEAGAAGPEEGAVRMLASLSRIQRAIVEQAPLPAVLQAIVHAVVDLLGDQYPAILIARARTTPRSSSSPPGRAMPTTTWSRCVAGAAAMGPAAAPTPRTGWSPSRTMATPATRSATFAPSG